MNSDILYVRASEVCVHQCGEIKWLRILKKCIENNLKLDIMLCTCKQYVSDCTKHVFMYKNTIVVDCQSQLEIISSQINCVYKLKSVMEIIKQTYSELQYLR